MKNAEKQYLAALELRVRRLESVIERFSESIAFSQYLPPAVCNQCGYSDPIKYNIVCENIDCCMGLNPNDDLAGSIIPN